MVLKSMNYATAIMYKLAEVPMWHIKLPSSRSGSLLRRAIFIVELFWNFAPWGSVEKGAMGVEEGFRDVAIDDF